MYSMDVPNQNRKKAILYLTEEEILEATGSPSLTKVFKLTYTGKGLQILRGLSGCTHLQELNLTGNSIERIQGLDSLTNLRKLVLTSNKISRVENLQKLANLEHLLLLENRISSIEDLNLDHLQSSALEEFSSLLKSERIRLPVQALLPKLKTVYLRNCDSSQSNPVCRLGIYRTAVLAALPNLRNLDGERDPASQNQSENARPPVRAVTLLPPAKPKGNLLRRFLPPKPTRWFPAPSLPYSPDMLDCQIRLQNKEELLVKSIDACRMLNAVLKEELRKADGSLCS